MVARGTRIIADVSGSADSYFSITPWNATDDASLRSNVDMLLSQYFNVYDIQIESATFDPGQWSFRAHCDLLVLADYGNLDDVASIIRHAFYEATGYLPTVTIPQTSQGLTGQPGQTPLPPGFDFSGLGTALRGTSLVLVVAAVAIGVYVWKRG